MANIKSAKKRAKQTVVRNARNVAQRSMLRTAVKKVIGVGKYISPKLYVGYGVSLVGAGSVITLKYLLRRGFDVEVESSTVENRGSINWRREK